MSEAFSVTFWGVRGSIAAPGRSTQRYGGNTPCLEFTCGDRTLVVDAGTGLPPLGVKLAAAGGGQELDVLFTHTHMDHFVGLPFFAPAYNPNNIIRFWAGHLRPERSLKEACEHLMSAPLFPVPPDVFQADVSFIDFECGSTLTPAPNIHVETAPLDHPGRAVGYRIEFHGRSIAVVTDTAHVPGKPNEGALKLMRDTDIVIYDAMFTEAEFAQRPDWGHSTWNEGVKLAEMAGAKQLVIFHHDPSRTDDQLDAILAEAMAARPGTIAAIEGETLAL
ncbi:MAG: MBL fold metallo-hydrolase [Alphaproteobacteria bacterium]